MWTALTILSIIAVILSFFRGQNAIWGGATIGLIIGIIIAIIQRFNWSILGKAVVIGILVGSIAEILGLLSDFLKKKA